MSDTQKCEKCGEHHFGTCLDYVCSVGQVRVTIYAMSFQSAAYRFISRYKVNHNTTFTVSFLGTTKTFKSRTKILKLYEAKEIV